MKTWEIHYREIRFVIREEFVDAYIFIDAKGEGSEGYHGWHTKTYGDAITVQDILAGMFSANDDCMLWPKGNPERN